MRLPRFSLATLFWLTAAVAIAIGLLPERVGKYTIYKDYVIGYHQETELGLNVVFRLVAILVAIAFLVLARFLYRRNLNR
jgi:hypothetical protein